MPMIPEADPVLRKCPRSGLEDLGSCWKLWRFAENLLMIRVVDCQHFDILRHCAWSGRLFLPCWRVLAWVPCIRSFLAALLGHLDPMPLTWKLGESPGLLIPVEYVESTAPLVPFNDVQSCLHHVYIIDFKNLYIRFPAAIARCARMCFAFA